MTYLPSLIKKIDNFYHLINLGAVTPDSYHLNSSSAVIPDYSYDPNKPQEQEIDERGDKLYQDIMSNLDNFENSSIADEVWTLAELYKASLLTGSGFDECLKRAKAAKGSVKDLANGAVDARDLADATRYILEIELNLTKAARSAPPVPKDDQVIAAQFKAIINDVKEKQANEEMAEQDSVYEKKKGEDAGEDFGYLIGNQIGVDKRKEQYEQEIAHLKEAQNNPNYQFSESERKNVPLLINVNRRLLAQMQSFVRAETALSAAPEDPEYKAAFEKEKEQLNVLRKERYKIRVELAKHFQTKKYDQFIDLANSSGSNLKQKQWFELNASFQKLRISDKYNKKPLIAALMQLIEETGKIVKPLMGQETFESINITPQRMQELIDDIKTANAKTLTPTEYDRIRTEERARLEGRKEVARRAPQRGGWGEGETHTKIDPNANSPAYFSSLVGKIGPGINTAVAGSSYYIAREKEGGYVALKPFIDAVSAAIRQRNEQAKYEAINKLREETAKYVFKKKNALQGYEAAIELAPRFREVEKKLKEIASWQKDGNWELDYSNLNSIVEITKHIMNLSRIYNSEYKDKKSNFDSLVTGPLLLVNNYLINNVLNNVQNSRLRVEQPASKLRVESPIETKQELEEFEEPEETPAKKRMQLMSQINNDFVKTATEPVNISEKQWLLLCEEFKKLLAHKEVYNKKPLKRALLKLINETGQMVNGKFISKQIDSQKLQEHISEVSNLKLKLLTPQVYDRIRHIKKSPEQNKSIMLGRSQRGGWGDLEKQNNYNYTLASFDGLIELFQEKINTAIVTAKQNITQPRYGGDAYLKPYTDAVTSAIAKKDKDAYYKAMNELKLRRDVAGQQVSEQSLKILEKSARLLPYFRKLKSDLKDITSLQSTSKEHIIKLIHQAERLDAICINYYQQPGQLQLYFGKTCNILKEIISRLKEAVSLKGNENE